MSGVPKVERVNINSGCRLTHFDHSWAVSNAFSDVHAVDHADAALRRDDLA